jgi:Flp pilus assembly protein TadD
VFTSARSTMPSYDATSRLGLPLVFRRAGTIREVQRSTLREVGPPLAVAVVTIAVFLPALWNGFVNWDDTTNFLNNPNYRGLGWKNLRWMATTFLLGQWIPLTWLTLGLDYVLWGMDPFGYHLTNVVLHCATAVVWYLVARHLMVLAAPSLGGSALTGGALAAALFFAIHPLRVESVAWVTERRDVLSGLFFVLAVLGYLRARTSAAGRGWLGFSIGCYALGALSKAMVVSLPVVLLLLDVYPLRRLDIRHVRLETLRRLVVEKVAYVAIALATGVMAIWAQQYNNFLTPLDRLPLLDRMPVLLYSVWFYFSKTLAPIGLSPLYELPAEVSLLQPRFLGSALGTVALTAVAALLARRWPALTVATAGYAVVLAPVSGLLHNGHQLVHDRYSYLPCLPWAVLFGAGVAFVLHAGQHALVRRSISRLATLAAAAWLAALGILTAEQVKVWRDDDTLWRYALDADPECSICHLNLGLSLVKQNLPGLAIPEFERALTLRSDRVEIHSNLGVALLRVGRPADALALFTKVRDRYPHDPGNRNNLAVTLLRLGRREEGMAELRSILVQDPQNVQARVNLGMALVEARGAEEGVAMLEGVVADKPDQVTARVALVWGYLALGRPEAARQALEGLRRLDARAAQALDGLFVTAW